MKLNIENPRNLNPSTINHEKSINPNSIHQENDTTLQHHKSIVQNAQKKYNPEINNTDQQYLSERLALRELKERMETHEKDNLNIGPKKASSLKFPMPKHYEPNNFPSRNLSTQAVLQEMVRMYDQKILPPNFEKFINTNMKKKVKEQKKEKNKPLAKWKKTKKTNKKKQQKRRKESESEADTTDSEQNNELIEQEEDIITEFNNLENHQFDMGNNVKIPNRQGNFLPYLKIRMNIMTEQREVIALKDSGASHSILDINEFKKFRNSKNTKVRARKLRMVTPNATTENAIQGEVEIEFTIEGIDGEWIELKHSFLLADLGGNQKCIIGYDFLGNESTVIGETPRHIFLKKKDKSYAIEILKLTRGHHKARPMASNKRTVSIAANTSQMVDLVCKSNFHEITSLEEKDCLFQGEDLTDIPRIRGLFPEPCLTRPTKIDNETIQFTAMVTNTTCSEITLKKNTELGSLEELTEMNNIQVSEDDFKSMTNHIRIEAECEYDLFETEEAGIYTFIGERITEINSVFNRNDEVEEEVVMPDGSVRSQLISNVEDILDSDTSFNPEELLDKEEKLDISMANFDSVPEDLKEELMNIIGTEMNDIWSRHKWDIGKTQRVKHDIKTKEGVVIRDKQRQIPYHRLQYAKKAVDTLHKYNLVSPAYNSKWATNLVLVQKPTEGNFRDHTKASRIHNKHKNTKSTWRLTQDLRRVNANTKNIYTSTLPTIDEIISKVKNKVVSQFDINQAYFTIELTDTSKEKTTFYLNDEVYYWNRMTQGLAGAPHTWMKFMKVIFNDDVLEEYRRIHPERGLKIKEKSWREFLSIYMDDIDVFSDTTKENLNHIHAVLWVLKKEGCLLNPKKANFMTTSFTTLGVKINTKENVVSIDKKKAQAILSWPTPTCLLEVMSRLQSLNYVSKNLPRLKEITFPLQTLIRNKVFIWEEEQQIAWEQLKELVKLDIRLTIPDPNMEYITSSDTSKIAIAGCLWNYDREGEKWYLLGCFSKLLNPSDSIKPPYYKEVLAFFYNLKYWESYLLGTKQRITALVDAKGIQYLHRKREHVNKIANISGYISQFPTISILHIAGEHNVLADIFTRSYHGSAHKIKEDFNLSRNHADNLPPLTNPCYLDEKTVFKILTTLPEPEPDFDHGNRKRRPISMPRPLLTIMKESEIITPEQKFMAARRLLLGWNDPNQKVKELKTKGIDVTNLEVQHFRTMEQKMEDDFIEKIKEELDSGNIRIGRSWEDKIRKLRTGGLVLTSENLEKNCHLAQLKDILPYDVMERIKHYCRKKYLEGTVNKDLLEKLIPTHIKLWEAEFIVPHTDEGRDVHQKKMKKILEEEKEERELEINLLDMIPEEDETEPDRVKLTNERQAAIIADMIMNHGKLSINTFKKVQRTDYRGSYISRKLERNMPQPGWSLKNNILGKTSYDKETGSTLWRPYIPDDMMMMVCGSIHFNKTVHKPRSGSTAYFNKYFYNPGAVKYFQNVIDHCITCKFSENPSGTPTPGPGKERTLKMENLRPREAIALDLVLSLPSTEDKYCNALTVICLKTNFGQIYPLKTRSSKEICEQLEKGWIKHFHAPKYVYTDMGLEFTGEMNKLCQKYGIIKYSTFPHSHQGNRAELLVKDFKINARKYIHDYYNEHRQTDWDKTLPIIIPRMNQSIIYSTKTMTRELLMFGDEIEMPTLKIMEDDQNQFLMRDTHQGKCLLEYDRIRAQRKNFYEPAKEMDVKENDLVFIKNKKDEYPKSLKLQYLGPMRVNKVFPLGITAYHVLTGEEMSAHFYHIKKMTLKQFNEGMPKGWHEDIKRHLLQISRGRQTNKIDLIFEEEEDQEDSSIRTE